jgi:hypothetical protein
MYYSDSGKIGMALVNISDVPVTVYMSISWKQKILFRSRVTFHRFPISCRKYWMIYMITSKTHFMSTLRRGADPSGCAVEGVGLRPLAYWNCGLESRLGHGCLSLVSVVCCQVVVSATGWSLVQRSPTECGVSKVWSWSLDKKEALAH